MRRMTSHQMAVWELEAELAALRTDLETERRGRAAETDQWVRRFQTMQEQKRVSVTGQFSTCYAIFDLSQTPI